MRILVTGGYGFIGSALIRDIITNTDFDVLNVDILTYAANYKSLDSVVGSPRYKFDKTNICEYETLLRLIEDFQPDVITHLAAETHVDRSIDVPFDFVNTNILGTITMLEAALKYFMTLSSDRRRKFRFHHISTDEVFGSLGNEGLFTEKSRYDPRSPYSASKASSDHLVRAWRHTYGLPTIITNCSNNYGPFQNAEKFIPRLISRALSGKSLPVYGDGSNIRDWLYVNDHVRALRRVFETAEPGETYNIGGGNEQTNIDVALQICSHLDHKLPLSKNQSYKEKIEFVKDRPGHDLRYAVDASKISRDLGWTPLESFESGLRKTIDWYVDKPALWVDRNDQKSAQRGSFDDYEGSLS